MRGGDLAVACRCASRDLAQRAPDSLLKRRALGVDREGVDRLDAAREVLEQGRRDAERIARTGELEPRGDLLLVEPAELAECAARGDEQSQGSDRRFDPIEEQFRVSHALSLPFGRRRPSTGVAPRRRARVARLRRGRGAMSR